MYLLKNASKNVLLCTLLLMALFAVASLVLSGMGFMFRQRVLLAAMGVSALGITAGSLQLIARLGHGMLRAALAFSFALLALTSAPAIARSVSFATSPEHVVEQNGSKYVAHVVSWLGTDVYYYDYVNPLVSGDTVKMEQHLGEGAFDPFVAGAPVHAQ